MCSGNTREIEYAKKMARGYLKSNGMGDYASKSPSKEKNFAHTRDKTVT